MDEETVKRIFDDKIAEYASKNKYGISDVPAHVHNGVDVGHVSMLAMDDIPVTKKGDIFTFGTNIAKLPVGTDGQYLVADSTQDTGLKYQTLPASQVDYTSSTFTAFENIADRDAVCTTSSSDTATSTGGGTASNFDADNYTATTITISGGVRITAVSATLVDNNNDSGVASIRRTSGGLPTGADLATQSFTVGNSGTSYGFSWTLSTPITVSPGEVIAVIFFVNGGVLGGRLKWQATGAGVSGRQYMKGSTGSSWTTTTNQAACTVTTDYGGNSGLIMRTSSYANDRMANTFLGFAVGAINAGQTGYVATAGILTGFSPQKTNGTTYYLQDTQGAIGTTPGTVSRKIGMGAKNGILIKNDNL